MQITTLVENSPGEHHALKTEHGISFYIEKEGHKLLFDTGQSSAFMHNASKLGLDLSDVEVVVLSHGHYDHSGGFRFLIGSAGTFRLVLGQGFFCPKYALRDGAYDFLGNDFDETLLTDRGIAPHFVEAEMEEILPGVHILSRFPRRYPDETVNPRFFLRSEGGFETDRFDDEVLLVLESSRGLVVLLGCSHPGMRNMLDAVSDRLDRSIYAVLGGTHLVEAHGERLERSLQYLRDARIGVVGVSHCTGEEAIERLRESHEGFFHNVTGSSLFVD